MRTHCTVYETVAFNAKWLLSQSDCTIFKSDCEIQFEDCNAILIRMLCAFIAFMYVCKHFVQNWDSCGFQIETGQNSRFRCSCTQVECTVAKTIGLSSLFSISIWWTYQFYNLFGINLDLFGMFTYVHRSKTKYLYIK